MGQTWEHLLFAHWPVSHGVLRPLVPSGLELETFEGSAWVGVTPFRVSGLRLRGFPPAPRLSTFLELNVRTYVSRDGRPGIWFFSLDAASRLAVQAARRLYRLPYHLATMRAEPRGDWIHYESARRDGGTRPFVFSGDYRARGTPRTAPPGSREHFLAERYCLYAFHRGRLHRADIHHPPWPLQAAEARIELNTMARDPIELTGKPLLHFSARQDVVIWPLEAV
jgi:uncharacterized protein YqjF (DUF2071 family)